MQDCNQLDLSVFKSYDIRGAYPKALNEDLVALIARAYVAQFSPKSIVVGWDARLSSEPLAERLMQTLQSCGVEVWSLGLCGTEEVYFATSYLQADGGIMMTASHNPKQDNGLKMVTQGSRPVGKASGLDAIKQRILNQQLAQDTAQQAARLDKSDKQFYIQHLLTYVDLAQLKPLKVVVNGGNGAIGPTFQQLSTQLPFEFIEINMTPDGNFPNGVPNPMLIDKRAQTIAAVQAHQADLGVAWDGDFDRCFLFDEHGAFIDGYYLIGLLAQTLLESKQQVLGAGDKIVYEPRLTWNTLEQVAQAGGEAVCARTGHVYIKEKMREVDAIYGGEISAHHYFKDFFYCDSGMIPWLLITQLLSQTGQSLSELVSARMQAHPCSGELNFTVEHADDIIATVKETFAPEALEVNYQDGLSIEYAQWRLNIRRSGTEPLLRLNIESRGDMALVQQKVAEVTAIIQRIG